MTRNKKRGLMWLLGPFALLLTTLSVFAISTFVLQALEMRGAEVVSTSTLSSTDQTSTADIRETVGRLVRVVLGLVGILAVIGIFVGIPRGAYLLTRKDEELNIPELQKNPAYAALTPDQIQYIQSWSWGAFFGVFIWSAANGLWLWALLALIPIVNIYPTIKLAISGRVLSWERGGWKSFDQFKTRQKIVAWVVLGLFLLAILSPLLLFILITLI